MNKLISIHNVLSLLVFVQQYSFITSYYHEKSMRSIKPPQNTTKNAYFAYSVTYVPSNKRLIVGAPNIFIRGAVFECDIINDSCIDDSPKIELSREETLERDGYWLGAAVEAGSDFYVVCAPRASNGQVGIFYRDTMKNVEGTAGLCFVRDFSQTGSKSWITLPYLNKVLLEKIYINICAPVDRCQDSFGWSISVYNKSILVGGPAMGTGRIGFYADWTSTPKVRGGPKKTYNYGYSVLMRPVKGAVTALVSYGSGVSSGYVELEDFTDDLQSMKPQNKTIRSRGNLGGTFGSAMSLMKHQNQDYLLVGAPSFSSARQSENYDIGCVYVYNMAIPPKKYYKLSNTIEGKHTGGYFGYCIVNIGDMNGDGTDEVAISAPYEDSGKGAVYIYSGVDIIQYSPNTQPKQKLQTDSTVYLGLSMTPMADLDDNGCSALGIGAPGNNQVIMLHCITPVTVDLNVKQFPNLQGRKNSVSDKVNETHFTFTWCFDIKYPEKLNSVELDLGVKIKLVHEYAKLVDNSEGKLENNVIALDIALREKKSQICKETTVYLPGQGIYEKPLELSIIAEQTNDPRSEDFKASRVLVSELSSLSYGPAPVWAAECSNQEACSPNLLAVVNTSFGNNYVVGSTEEESISISVTNYGDVAYQSCVRIIVNGVKVKQLPDCQQIPPYELLCKSLGPLKNMKSWNISNIILEMGLLNSKNKEIGYQVHVQNDCRNTSHIIEDSFRLRNDAEGVNISGTDNIEGLGYIRDNQPKNVKHKYEITNNGTTNWVDLKFTLNLTTRSYIYGYSSNNLQISTEGSLIPTQCVPTYGIESTVVVCSIESLNKGQMITVSYDSIISSKNLENNMNITVNTSLSLNHQIKPFSVQTKLLIQRPVIPVWMIIVSLLFGLLLFTIMAVIMYEIGCFKRKDKRNLQALRSSIRRQTLRKSMSEAFEAALTEEKDLIILDDGIFFDDRSFDITAPEMKFDRPSTSHIIH